MSPLSFLRRTAIAWSALPLLAACGDGGTGPNRLTSAEVGGVYRICALVFQPNQTLLPSVDVRAEAMDTSAQATVPARLFIDNQTSRAELEFSAPSSTLPRRHAATYQTGERTIVLTFAAAAPILSELLLPGFLELEFQAEPKQLDFIRTGHDVPRQSYATLADVSPEGLADPIRGTVSARFRVGSCG